jgi:potassium efflux system protein
MTFSLPRLPTLWIVACWLALAAVAPAATAAAQAVPAAGGISIEVVKDRLASAQARQDFGPALKTQIIAAYQNAIAALQSANSLRAEIATTKKTQDGAQETIQRLERELRSVRAESAVPDRLSGADALPLDALQRLESRKREEVEQARQRVAELQHKFDDIVGRPLSTRPDLAALRAEAASYEAQAPEPTTASVPAALAAALRDLALARETERHSQLARFDQEVIAQPVLARIAQLELDVAQAELDVRAADQVRVRALFEKRQRTEIAKGREEAARIRQMRADSFDPGTEIRARILERRAQIAEVSLATSAALGALSQRKEQLADIGQSLRATKLRVATATQGNEIRRTLLGQIRALPVPVQFQQAADQRAEATEKAADARLDVELERTKLADLDRATADAMAGFNPDLPPASRAKIEAAVRTDLAQLQRLLRQLNTELNILLQTLRAVDQTESAMLGRAQDFRVELVRLLLWIPVSPVALETFNEIGHAAKWIVSGDNWRGVAKTWWRATQRDPVFLLLAALVLCALLAARGWFKRRLPTLAPGAIALHTFRIRYTFEALSISLLLALPLPFAIWTIGFVLGATQDAPLFAQSTGAALRLAAGVLLFFRAVRWLFDSGGVAIKHFSWHMEPVLNASRVLQQLMVLYVPLEFVAILATSQAPEPVRQSLGRIAFVCAMLAVAVFWRRAFHPDRPLARLDRDDSTIALRLLVGIVIRAPVWFGVVLAAVSLAGFYLLAAFLHRLLLETVMLAFSVAIAYGLITLWLAVQRLRLAAVEAQQASAVAQTDSELADVQSTSRSLEIDVDAIDAQTRQLLNLFMTIVIGAGLWVIWSDAFATMDFGTDLALWSYSDTIDDKSVTRTIALSGLLLAVAVGMVAYVGTRNVGGLLDILLLQRLRLQADANYAIKTVARYATVGVGIVVAAGLLGIRWSSVQWLVAALGVGLGFGLQEIVANFVSGLIVLGERPIRIGDVITVGETTGTVTRIRARATVITDWDNKEVMIPNKAFITERVINWTLSNKTTRVLLAVGIAYGTDPARAAKVLDDAVRANPNVLADPAPRVFFMAFGDSSLDFEIRAYVDATNKRLQTIHELNTAIAGALAAAGIEIPFPQRDLHIRRKK